MEVLKEKIRSKGNVLGNDIIKVDSFLNHQIDIQLMNAIGLEFANRFSDKKIDKILTIEASGIAVACLTALHLNVPVVFAKKQASLNLDLDTYSSEVFSFTKNCSYNIRVDRKYISGKENILIIDDFLANGKAALGLADIATQASANVVGIGIVIEKGFQEGGAILRNMGYRLESLAIIESLKNGEIIFIKER